MKGAQIPANPDPTSGWTPEEKYLYQIHLDNLKNAPVINADGSVSTLRQMSFEQDGKTYNVPTVWDGKVHSPNEAIARANKIGLSKFPSYKNTAEAERRYNEMHKV